MSPPPIEDVLGRVAVWAGRTVRHRPIEGGLSHHIWRVDAGDRSYVLRVLDPAVSEVGLGIPPVGEIANTRAAARSGVGARVFEVLPDVPALVLEYLPGRTLSSMDVADSRTMDRIALACRRLHAGPRFDNDFDIVAKLHQLLDVCRRNELRTPDGYTDRLAVADAVGAALYAAPLTTVPCHNDLLAENFIDVGGEIRIVDYQLSGNNDPSFELGDIAAEADLDPDQTGRLAAGYFGDELTPALTARVRLQLMLSNYAWTLWFSVHHGLLDRPSGGFDYWAEADDKWRQAVRDLDSPEFGRLLDTTAGRQPAPSPAGTAETLTPAATAERARADGSAGKPATAKRVRADGSAGKPATAMRARGDGSAGTPATADRAPADSPAAAGPLTTAPQGADPTPGSPEERRHDR